MASKQPVWMRSCIDGPHREQDQPCGCPQTGFTCCLGCPFTVCVIDQKPFRERQVSMERGRKAREMLERGHTTTEVTIALGIDHTQLKRALKAVTA